VEEDLAEYGIITAGSMRLDCPQNNLRTRNEIVKYERD